jgi:hypothetical protein
MRRAYDDRLVKLLHEELAEGVDEGEVARDIGVNERLLNYWKMQGSLPRNLAQFLLLCRRLRTHPNYLLGWTDDRYPQDDPQARVSALDEQLAKLGGSRRKR